VRIRVFSTHHVNRTWPQLVGLMALASALYLAAGIGMASVAGFDQVHRRLAHAQWWWIGPAAAAVLVAFYGYYFAYRGIERIEGGPELGRPALLAVVIAGFGGFLAHGGTAIDEFAMRAGGADGNESKVRVGALAAFEHGVLALIVCPAAIAALLAGVVIPRTDFSWPWALIPPPAFALGFWLAERYRDKLRGRGGWRHRLVMFFDTAHLVFEIMRHPVRRAPALVGMLVYWGADMFGLWATTAAFGFHMTLLAVIVSFGTGMLFTRRTAPLGGAGLMVVALVPALWYGAAVPFAVATLGVASYRALTVGLPLPFSLAAIPKLRELGRTGEDSTGSGTATAKGEPALQH
jgi:hypothetical protein